MDAKNGQQYFIRNVEDGQTISLSGDGEFCIGLTSDESIACSLKSSYQQDQNIVVPLVLITIWKTSGVTISPANRDLYCTLNGVVIASEANIIPGNQFEVGDKVLELLDGATTKSHRRHLPPTPGIPILATPPPKPLRTLGNLQQLNTTETFLEDRDALREWCLSHLPENEAELLEIAKTPEKLSNLASSFLIQHINLLTDVVMSVDLMDRIFKMIQEVSHHRRDIVKTFLNYIIKESHAATAGKGKQNEYHNRVTSFLVEIIKQFLDPSYLVLLCLQLLRALSHVPGNVSILIANNTVAAVLGSMAVYKDNETVQNHSLDILAKLATYVPAILEKPPLRESTIDLASMAMTLHSNNLRVTQAGIRTLANLASSLHTLSNLSMQGSPYPDLRAFVILVISVLEYLYTNTSNIVPSALSHFNEDLTIKTDGRRFMFEYAKMEQLKHQQKLWELAPDVPPRIKPSRRKCSDNNDNSSSDETTSGILKRSRSFENLKNPERRVSFVEESDLVSSSSFSSSASSDVDTSHPIGSPDVQIISRMTISPPYVSQEEDSVSCTKPVRPPPRNTANPDLLQDDHLIQNISISSHSTSRKGPVDLTGVQLTTADVKFMKRLISVQMVGFVCSASIEGDNPKALKMINMPLKKFLHHSEVPKVLCQFADAELDNEITLMDIDPSTVISVIDAVRYKMLAFDLTKKSLQALIQNLTSTNVNRLMFGVTKEVVLSLFNDKMLSAALFNEEFINDLKKDLQKFQNSCQTTDDIFYLIDDLMLVINFNANS